MNTQRTCSARRISLLMVFALLLSCIFAATSCQSADQTTETDTNPPTGDTTASISGSIPSETETEAIPEPILTGDPLSAAIVYPNDASGAVSFVVDDGYQDTALIISDELLPKYDHLRISYGLITDSLAELDSDYGRDGIEEYFLNRDGNYEYFYTNRKNVDFWTNHISENDGYCEILSHSYTHAMWGNDDAGGEQTVQLRNGGYTTITTAKGAVTVELKGAQQIIRELLGQESNYFIMPGTDQVNSQYYLSLLKSGKYYRGARTTTKNENVRDTIKAPFSYINAWMVTPDETPDQWTDFIDNAVANGNWACFCIHNILKDSSANPWGHYLYQSNADKLFGHANQLAENGALWIGTMSEVADYLQYWNASTVTALYDQNRNAIGVSVTANDMVADYDVNITVKVALPDTWENGAQTVDGVALDSKVENGKIYVLVPVSSDNPTTMLLPA